jgi:molybdopterin converting factor small subunit
LAGAETCHLWKVTYWPSHEFVAQEIRVSVTIHLHKSHRRFAAGQERVDVEGYTVGECLRNLVDQFPELKPQLFDGRGRLQKTVEIYLNMASAYPDELARPTTDGDRIHITLMLAGG